MSFQLTDLLSHLNTTVNTQTDAAENAASVSDAAKAIRTNMVLQSLSSGQTISGLVKSVQGSQILLDLGQDVELTARLDRGMDISAGRSLLFEVKSNHGGKVSLSPLYTNLSADNTTAVSALKAAAIPVNNTSVVMANTMIQEGMSVDKASLWEMNRLVNTNTGFPAESVVRLKAMDIPVTTENLTQFQNYQNQNHHMLQSIEFLSSSIEDTMMSFFTEGQTMEGLSFAQNLLQIFDAQSTTEAELGQQTGVIAGERAVVEGNLNVLDVKVSVENILLQDGKNAFLESVAQILQEGITDTSGTVLDNGSAKLNEFLKQFGQFIDTDGNLALSREEYENVGKVFSKLLSTAIKSEWLMKPEDFADKEKVKEFYQKMSSQTEKISDLFAESGKSATEAGKSVTSLQQNLSFMNDLNQAFPYLQIPLKAAMENAHGDLYVYTKKKQGKEDGDESVTALLHLEMQHLGNLDVFVKLQEQNVSTHFTLEDEAMIDFLAAHMHLLDERLEQKGYHMESKVTVKEKTSEEVINRIRGISGDKVPVIMNSFDVRA